MNEYKTFKEVNSLFSDFINGYSFLKEKQVYLKHPTNLDLSYGDNKYIDLIRNAQSNGILTNKEKLDILKNEKMWDNDKDRKILELKSEVANLKQTKNKLFIAKQVKEISEKILERDKELNLLLLEKEELMGETAETYANKKANEYLILSLIFKDKNFNENVFSEEDIEELDYVDLNEHFINYGAVSKKYEQKNLKKIAVLPAMINSIFLVEDNPELFFGKTIMKLSIYQLDAYSKLKSYKNVLTKGNSFPPENLYDDFDQLVSWYDSSGTSYSAQPSKEKKEKSNASTSYIGATKDELEKIAKSKGDTPIDLVKEAEKKGGQLSFKDIIKLHE